MDDLVSQPIGSIRLRFDAGGQDEADGLVRDNLSAVALSADHLWVATDEGAAVERLTRQPDGTYGEQVHFDLRPFLTLPDPDGADVEIDIEGMDVDGERLWLVGSHAVTRDKPKGAEHDPADAVRQLAQTDANPNRRILAGIALSDLEAARTDTPARNPEAPATAQLKASRKHSALLDLLADDPHLGPFMDVPAKENGFDVEGLAVRGEQVLLGLRGPVLRGWAIILELRLRARHGRLNPKRLAPDQPRYRKHFLDLEGGGIRDLCFSGDDLLILAGPTMALDGIVRIHRWTPPPSGGEDTLTPCEHCRAIMEVPAGRGCDHAEGMALVADSDPPQLMVVYDSPKPARLADRGAVDADLFAIPR